jgi:putative nucleotidyltransferase with HDIG domain
VTSAGTRPWPPGAETGVGDREVRFLGARRVLRELNASRERVEPWGGQRPDGRAGRDVWLTSGLMYFIAAADPGQALAAHSRAVAAYAGLLARAMGIGEARFLRDLERGALLHDIGKSTVPEPILEKAAPLDDLEREIIREHPVVGFRMLEEFGFLRPAAEIVLCHHERYDGRGYPAGLRGDCIPPGARILAVADALDALTADRAYSRARPMEEAIREIGRSGGRHFDPAVVDVFLTVAAGAWLVAGRGAAALVRPPSVH